MCIVMKQNWNKGKGKGKGKGKVRIECVEKQECKWLGLEWCFIFFLTVLTWNDIFGAQKFILKGVIDSTYNLVS